jgi:hypothetical protein
MAQDRCPLCDQLADYTVAEVIPPEVQRVAQQQGKTPQELYPHIGWDRVSFAAHNATCGLPCAYQMTLAEKQALLGQCHAPEHCPTCSVVEE